MGGIWFHWFCEQLTGIQGAILEHRKELMRHSGDDLNRKRPLKPFQERLRVVSSSNVPFGMALIRHDWRDLREPVTIEISVKLRKTTDSAAMR